MRLADIIVLYKEFPHTDVVERAEDLLDLVLATLRGKIKPVMSLYDCRQIQSYPTTLPLMRAFVDRIKAMEGKDGILSISIVHCFPYADVPELSGRVLVVADGDKAKADALATKLGEEMVSMRGKTMPEFLDTKGGVAAALAFNAAPVVVAEPVRQCRRRRAVRQHQHSARADRPQVPTMWRWVRSGTRSPCGCASMPGSARPSRCASAARPARRPASRSMPTVEVIGLAADCWQSFGPTKVPLGDCAAIRIGGVEVVLITKRTQALGLELFTNLGIDPRAKKVVVVKSTNHFMAAFGPIAKKVIYVDSDAPLSRDYRKIAYTRVQRPIWPLDEKTEPGLIF